MLRNIIILSFLLLLSSCGYYTCLAPNDVLKENITDLVLAKPNGMIKGHYDTYWTKSNLLLDAGQNVELKITVNNLNICYDLYKKVDILPGTQYVSLGFTIENREAIIFTMEPFREAKFTRDICYNREKEIYVQNPEDCLANYLEKTYSYMIPSDADTRAEAVNVYFANSLGDVFGVGKKWFAGNPSYVLKDNNSNGMPTDPKEIEKYTKVYKDYEKYLCNSHSSNDNSDELVRYAKKLKQGYDAKELNTVCKSFCMSQVQDQNSGDISIVNNGGHCAQSETVINGRSYLPSLHVSYDPGFFSSSNLPEYGTPSSGVLSNSPYKFDNISVKGIDKLAFTLKDSRWIPGNLGAGGYKIRITKDCSDAIERSLYYYISDVPPHRPPGEIGKPIILDKGIFKEEENAYEYTLKLDSNEKGDIYFGIKTPGNNSEELSYEYYQKHHDGSVQITAALDKKPVEILSKIVKFMNETINKKLYGSKTNTINAGDKGSAAVGKIYGSILQHVVSIVRALLLLYILLYALYYLLGRSKSSMSDILIAMIKIGIVLILLSDNSWSFFYNNLFVLFTKFPVELADTMTNVNSAKSHSSNFLFLDRPLYRFTLPQTWLQILSLVFSGPVGWLTICLIFWGLWAVIECLFGAVIMYFISAIIIGVLLSIAPFFIICILFKRTNLIFNLWIVTLVQTAMQPVLAFTIIAMLSSIMDSVIFSLFDFKICTNCIFETEIVGSSFCLLNFLLPVGFSPIISVSDSIREAEFNAAMDSSSAMNFIGIPLPITKIIIFVILCNAMRNLVSMAGEISTSIFGSFANLKEVTRGSAQSILSVIGMDSESRANRVSQHYHSKLGQQNAGGSGSSGPPIDSAANLPKKNSTRPNILTSHLK